MKSVKTWFGGLSKTGKIVTMSTTVLLTMGTVNAMANQSQPSAPIATTPSVTAPVTTYKEVQETEPIAFKKTTRDDDTRDEGTSAVTTLGRNGVRTKTYKITLVDGSETARTLLKEDVTTPAIDEVTSVGTKRRYVAPAPASKCDSNYSDCVPVASDVDCAGGSGDGPAYVSGAVQVIGSDIYGLDRDNDGWGCE